ncbi:unnamed protein product [Onchocerca flexuosa]|uniref:Sensor histidine kinase n=1 Tax=Onchocerca flexuosa TaxID=387005 RepID=A0A183HU69_9BILA|nr:unnamed protein product [Onchocerca flexuosa]
MIICSISLSYQLFIKTAILSDARERLKDSDLSLFGNIDEILAAIPGNLDAHMQAVIQLNNSIDNKVKKTNKYFFYVKRQVMLILRENFA